MDQNNRTEIELEREKPHAGLEMQGLWFFLPLPHPIGLPPGWGSTLAKSTAEIWNDDGSPGDVDFKSSLLIHQLRPSLDPLATQISDLMAYAIAMMSDRDPAEVPSRVIETEEASPLKPGLTLAEVAIPGRVGKTDDELLAALEIAIDHVRWVQRAVAAATQRPVRLMSRTTLPPVVPTFRATAYEYAPGEKYRKPSIDESIMWFIPQTAPPVALGAAPDTFGDEVLSKIRVVMDRTTDDNPFFLYTDLRREALVQRQFEGNHRMTLVALATAGEVLCDTILMSMLWEEHVEPAAAAGYFDRSQGHTARVARFIPPRIGGGWAPSARSAAGVYLRDLVRLRHRVVHAGHHPTAAEVEAASVALFGLEKYIGDRLVAGQNLKKYPRTAVAWMAETGLRRRNRFTGYIQRLMADEREPNWDETFTRWRRHVDRALDPSPQPPGADPRDVVGFAECLPGATIRWTVHDGSTSHAAVVGAADIATPEQIAGFDQAVAAMAAADDEKTLRVLIPMTGSLAADLQWRPDHEVYDDVEIFPRTATPGPVESS